MEIYNANLTWTQSCTLQCRYVQILEISARFSELTIGVATPEINCVNF